MKAITALSAAILAICAGYVVFVHACEIVRRWIVWRDGKGGKK